MQSVWFVRELPSSFADRSFIILGHTYYKAYKNDALGLEFF